MTIEFEISTTLPAAPAAIYAAWLDSARHSEMTGGAAAVSAVVGGRFSAWDGYISGKNLVLEPDRRIVQSWRTIEFHENDPDSRVDIGLEPHEDGARVTINHSNLPPHGAQYEQGWVDNYFEPMRRYFQTQT